MNEENMKNYSIRLGDDEVKRLETLGRKHFYWKRSGIIRGIILAVLKALPDSQVYDLIRYGLGARDLEIKITISKAKKES